MALNIKDPATDRLARKLAAKTGASITVAVRTAIEHRLIAEAAKNERERERMFSRVRKIQERVAAMPDRIKKSDNDIIGYNDFGAPE